MGSYERQRSSKQPDHHPQQYRVQLAAPTSASAGLPLLMTTPAVLPRALADPRVASPRDILALQRTHGNRAVTRLIQAKLTVGPAGDQYEQEAERQAQQVMSGPAPRSPQPFQRQHDEPQVPTKPVIRRVAPGAKSEASQDIEDRLHALQGSGRPLPPGVRAQMESSFGVDFSGVRVHTGGEAVQLNRGLQAKAFTQGQHIYFGEGAFDPGAAAGQQLLAHELTHVVQQTGGTPGPSPFPRIQRYFTVQAADPLHPHRPAFTAAVDAQFPSQEFVEGQARRTTKRVRAAGNLRVSTQAHGGAAGWQPHGQTPPAAMNTLSLNVSQHGRMAIENTTAQPRAFYADNQIVIASNQQLRDIASPVRLVPGGGTVRVPTDPDPAHHDPTPKTLTKVAAQPNIPADHPSELAGQALINAAQNSECNNVVKLILGAAESARNVVLGRAADQTETEVEGRERLEPIYEIANFVATTNVGSGNVGNLATVTQTAVPYLQQPTVETNYNALAAPPPAALGINAGALPEVGEGYAIRSLAGVTRPGPVTFTNVSGTDVDDQYLEALQMLHAAGGMLDPIIRNMAADRARANRAMALKTFWGEHYAGVVAKDGSDTITYENYNRAPQWKWPINEAFNNLYRNMATFRQYIRGLGEVLQARNFPRQQQLIADFAHHLATTGIHVPARQQRMVDKAVDTAQGNIDNASDSAKEMMYFQMYGQRAGQSFHEKFTTSPSALASTANAMTLRVRTNLNLHRQDRQNALTPKIAAITAALNRNSTDAHLNATLQNRRATFGITSGQVMQDIAAATTIREVEEAAMRLNQANDDVWGDLHQELLLIDPTAAPPANRINFVAYVLTLINAYHIGGGVWGRGARVIHKRALQTVHAVASGLPSYIV